MFCENLIFLSSHKAENFEFIFVVVIVVCILMMEDYGLMKTPGLYQVTQLKILNLIFMLKFFGGPFIQNLWYLAQKKDKLRQLVQKRTLCCIIISYQCLKVILH